METSSSLSCRLSKKSPPTLEMAQFRAAESLEYMRRVSHTWLSEHDIKVGIHQKYVRNNNEFARYIWISQEPYISSTHYFDNLMGKLMQKKYAYCFRLTLKRHWCSEHTSNHIFKTRSLQHISKVHCTHTHIHDTLTLVTSSTSTFNGDMIVEG